MGAHLWETLPSSKKDTLDLLGPRQGLRTAEAFVVSRPHSSQRGRTLVTSTLTLASGLDADRGENRGAKG